jgi:MFS family permease
VFGLFLTVTSLPLVLLLLRDDPRQMGQLPDGLPAAPPAASGARAAPQGWSGSGLPRGYWLVFTSNVLRGMATYALMVHQVAYMVDVGFSKMAAASFFSLTFLLAVLGGLSSGAVSDRIGRVRTYAVLSGLGAAAYGSLLLLRGPGQLALLAVFVICSGLAWGGVSSVYAAFLTDRLQGPRLGFLLGLQNIGFGMGATLGPYLAGAAFDALRSYTLPFLLMAAAMLASAALLSFRPKAPRRA